MPNEGPVCDMKEHPECQNEATHYVGTPYQQENYEWEYACEKHAEQYVKEHPEGSADEF